MDNRVRNEKILELMCGLLEKMNVVVEKAFAEDAEGEENQVLVGIQVENPGALIGFRGRNLAAIQSVLGLIVKAELGEWVKVVVDINEYRVEQRKKLEEMAERAAEKVLETGEEVEMMPMSAYERRIVHLVIQEKEGVESESRGEEEERRVVIRKNS